MNIQVLPDLPGWLEDFAAEAYRMPPHAKPIIDILPELLFPETDLQGAAVIRLRIYEQGNSAHGQHLLHMCSLMPALISHQFMG